MEIQNKQNSRLLWPDLAKGIGMILVIIAHSPYPSTPVRAFITAFHMPLFFVVSGMLMYHTGEEERNFKTIVVRKAKNMLIPYVTFSILYLLLDVAAMYIRPENVVKNALFKKFVEFVTLYGISVLWFLTALFFGELFFLGIKKLVNRTKRPDLLMPAAGALAAAVLLGASRLFHTYYPLYRSMPLLFLGDFIMVLLRGVGVMSFLTIGYYLQKLYFHREAGRGLKGIPEVVCGVFCFAAVFMIAMKNGVVDFHFLYFFQPVLYLTGAVLGSVGTVLVSRHLWNSRLLYFFGANSLLIMVTHLDCRVLITAINYANWLNLYVTRAKVYVLYLNVAIMVILLEVVLVKVIHRWLPFLLGKPWRKKAENERGERYENK